MTGGAGLASRHGAPGAVMRSRSALGQGAGALQYALQRTRHDMQYARQRLGSRYKFGIVTGGGDDTTACARDKAQCARGMSSVSRYNFYIAERGAALCHDMTAVRATQRYDTVRDTA